MFPSTSPEPCCETTAVSQRKEARRLQRRLEVAARIVGRAAHDFGNVLTGILGFTELSLAQVPPQSPLAQYLREIQQAAQRGVHLTTNLRYFSQRSPAAGQPISLAQGLAVEQARVAASWGPAVALVAHVPPHLPRVCLAEEPLRQILGRLLDNAREAMAESGTVTVSAQHKRLTKADCQELYGNPRPGDFVEVIIADTGVGFSPAAQLRALSEPFTTSKPQHRGLGLAVVHGLLCAYRGGLCFQPNSPSGTRACVYLPAEVQTLPESSPLHEVVQRILVVEDDPLISNLICKTLERAGYGVQAVASADQALAVYASAAEPFQLVLTDPGRPKRTEPDLARQLLAHNPAVNILFVGDQMSADNVRQEWAGQNFAWLAKPFHPDGLLRAVKAVLNRESCEGASTSPLPVALQPLSSGSARNSLGR